MEDDAVQDPDAAQVDRDQHGEDWKQDRHIPPDVDRDQGVQALEGDVVGDDRGFILYKTFHILPATYKSEI